MLTPTATPAPQSQTLLILTALRSSVLLYISFFPLNLGFFAWIALVPLLHLVDSTARSRHVYLAAFIGGLGFYIPAMQWMRVAHPAMYATWIVLALMCAGYFALDIFLIRLLRRRGMPLVLAAPVVFVGLDYFRANFPTGFTWMEPLGIQHRIGFSWYFLGYTQHDFVQAIQIADLGGVYAVSFVVISVNAVVYQWSRCLLTLQGRYWSALVAGVLLLGPLFYIWWRRVLQGSTAPRPWSASVAAGALLLATLAYGFETSATPRVDDGPRVAMLQSNLPQAVKMGEADTMDQQMRQLLVEAVNVPQSQFPDMIIWPETTCSGDWYELGAGVETSNIPEAWRSKLQFSSRLTQGISGWKTNQLLGLNGMELDRDGKTWKYNSAKLINKDGTAGPRYDKMHLVPFGEYVPLKSTFPWLQKFTPYTHDYSCKPGEHWSRFPLKVGDREYVFGCVICYEDSDPSLARRYAVADAEGRAVDFLVNISNDGWFNGTEEHEQHLAICRFRAVECRRAIVRSVNMGISCIIDANGRVSDLPGPSWAESVKISTVVRGVVPIDARSSIYPQVGDWVPLMCLILFGVGWCLPYVRSSRRADR